MAFSKETSYVKRVRRHSYIKPFAALLTAVMLLGLAGCDKSENPVSVPKSSSGDSQNISSDRPIEDFKPVPVPEGGWTVESLAKTIRINGEPLPEPFTVDNLGEKYTVELTSNGKGGNLRFEKRDIAVIVFSKEDESNDYRNREITHLLLNDPVAADIITVNGVGIGSSSDDVRKNLGKYFVPPLTESNDSSGFSGFYYSNNTWDDSAWDDGWGDNTWILEISFDSSNKVDLMNFNFE